MLPSRYASSSSDKQESFDPETVLRGGYGVYYSDCLPNIAIVTSGFASQGIFTNTTSGVSPVFKLSSGVSAFSLTQNLTASALNGATASYYGPNVEAMPRTQTLASVCSIDSLPARCLNYAVLTEDLQFTKRTRLTDALLWSFYAQAFNPLNRHRLRGFGTAFGASNFGQPSAAVPPVPSSLALGLTSKRRLKREKTAFLQYRLLYCLAWVCMTAHAEPNTSPIPSRAATRM